MTRLAMLMVAVLAVGCETKPSEDECRKAITNMLQLMGTENTRDAQLVESQVRRCKGGSSKRSVDCAISAQTLDELRKCDFFKVPEGAKGIGAGTDQPAPQPPPGSADPAGPADPGAGSADPAAAPGEPAP